MLPKPIKAITFKKSRFSLAALVIFLAFTIPLLVILDTSTVNGRLENPTTTKVNPTLGQNAAKGFNGLFVFCNVTNVDLVNRIVNLRFRFTPVGDLAAPSIRGSSNNDELVRPNRTFNLIISDSQIRFNANGIMPNQQINLPIEQGSVNRYPFDRHTAELMMIAFDEKGSIPVAFAIAGAVQAFRMDFQPKEATENQLVVPIHVFRSFTVAFFSIFIFLMMWALSFAIFTLATTLWLRDRKVEPPTIGICIALLFALPAIRNSQPGVPPIGCTLDLAGFFWCMFLVMMSSCILIVNYIQKYKKDDEINQSK